MRTPISEANRCADTTMPCSASTAEASIGALERIADRASTMVRPLSAALRGRGRGPRSGRVRWSPSNADDETRTPSPPAGKFLATGQLPYRLVQPLVVEGAFERGELVAEFLVVRRRHTRIEGLPVPPHLDQGEMVRVAVPLHDVIPQIAVVPARGIRLRLDELDGLVLVDRENVDMGEHINRLGRHLPLRRCNRKRAVRPDAKPANHQRLNFVSEGSRGGARIVRIRGLLVTPCFEYRKPRGPTHLFEHIEAGIAVLLAARLGVLARQCHGLLRRRRIYVEIGDYVDRAAHCVLRMSGLRCPKDEHGEGKNQGLKTHLLPSAYPAGERRKRQSVSWS